MKIAFVADCHLGNHKRFGGDVVSSLNERCRLTLGVFERAVRIAKEEGCGTFVVAGDLFDYARPEAPLIAVVQSILSNAQHPVLLVGNHDKISTGEDDHALAPLRPTGARIVETPTRLVLGKQRLEFLAVPFQSGHAREWLAGAVRGIVASSEPGAPPHPPEGGGARLLALHLGIKDAKTAPWLAGAADSIDVDVLDAICAEHHIAYVFAGNWHDRREWRLKKSGAYVLQLGALCPTGWDNPGIDGYGTVAIFDPSSDEVVKVIEVPGPRFVKVTGKREAQVEMVSARKRGHQLFVSFDANPDDMAELTTLVEAAKERKDIHAGEVIPNKEEASIQAKSAAFAAKSAKTLHEALEGFVRRMPLPDNVNRGSVLERARGYLR
jgi:DNA repair exonuclease SbcCD nuclease subunit